MAVKILAHVSKAVRRAASKKSRKPRKPKRVTRKMMTGSYRKVWNGTKKFTFGGLTKDDLMLGSGGKIVSKRRSIVSSNRRNFAGWNTAIMQARKDCGITGFVLINRGAQGVALYKRAKEIYLAGSIGYTPR